LTKTQIFQVKDDAWMTYRKTSFVWYNLAADCVIFTKFCMIT